jgi:P4 family phage/plasmid primase-like protien
VGAQLQKKKMVGWVYAFVTPSDEGVVKFGATGRDPAERLREANSTWRRAGHDAYAIAAAARVDDPFAVERAVHLIFASRRVDPRREFFHATADEARALFACLPGVSGEQAAVAAAPVDTNAAIIALIPGVSGEQAAPVDTSAALIVARYFHTVAPDAYLWCEKLGWYSLGDNNVWRHYGMSHPSGLKRHISETLQGLAMKKKIAELAAYARTSANVPEQEPQKGLLKKHKERLATILAAYKKLGSSDFINGVIAFLPPLYEDADLEGKMDMSRYIFAFTDGAFDLRTCEFHPIVAKDYVSTTCGYEHPRQSRPDVRVRIEALLWGLFENKETEQYMLRVIASCLLGVNRWEEFYVLTGSGGNGKGVIADLLKLVFGGYYTSVDSTLFTKPLERKGQPVPALVEARPKRIMMTTEPESDDRLHGELLKKMSGGDPIEARALHSSNIVTYVPAFKLFMQTNNIPRLSKIDGCLQRRMRIIHFPFKFVPADQITERHHRLGDPDVKERLCKSAEWRDEMCLLLTETWKAIRDMRSLTQPIAVAEATGVYLDDNNPLKTWLTGHYTITKSPFHTIGAANLKGAYLRDTQTERISDFAFKSLMKFNCITKKRTSGGVVYIGLQRKPPTPHVDDS